MGDKAKNSYGTILKSSSLVGGSQAVAMLIGMIRTKFVAVLLGPTGLGLSGTYMAMQHFAIVLAGLGINQSGVRDISTARGSGESQRITETVNVLRKLSLWLGILGALIISVLASPLSRLTFGDSSHAWDILALGVSVLMGLVTAAQKAVMQGFRRIGDIAKTNILGTSVGAVAAISWYYALRMEGIIPAILTLSVLKLCFSWYYARKVEVSSIRVSFKLLLSHSKKLLGLGLAFMWTGLCVAAMAYIIRLVILREFDLVTVGIYAAAYRISGMILDFVMRAMGADYYPRLSEANEDHPKMVKLVNEQAEIGVILALPAIVGLIIGAPILVHVFYTDAFLPAVQLIQWFALGCFTRVFQWPLGFVMLALNKGATYAGIQTGFHLLHLLLIMLAISLIGLEGVGVAFFMLYCCSFWIIYLLSKKLINFEWVKAARQLLLIAVALVILTFVLAYNSQGMILWLGGAILLGGTLFLSAHGLIVRVGHQNFISKAILRYVPFARRWVVMNNEI